MSGLFSIGQDLLEVQSQKGTGAAFTAWSERLVGAKERLCPNIECDGGPTCLPKSVLQLKIWAQDVKQTKPLRSIDNLGDNSVMHMLFSYKGMSICVSAGACGIQKRSL